MSSRWEAHRFRGFGSLALLAACAGCNALDEPLPEGEARLVIPTDVRPAVHAVNKPPPMSGGTLLVTRSGTLAVVSDPERDVILVADLASSAIAGTIALQ